MFLLRVVVLDGKKIHSPLIKVEFIHDFVFCSFCVYGDVVDATRRTMIG